MFAHFVLWHHCVASSENYWIHITEETLVFRAVCTLHEYADVKAYVCFTMSPVEKGYELLTKPYILAYVYWHVTKQSDFKSEALWNPYRYVCNQDVSIDNFCKILLNL